MSIRRKGATCDPCCNDWKEKLKFLWEQYSSVVKSIRIDAKSYYPDGQGQVRLPTLVKDLDVRIIPEDDHYILAVADITYVTLTDMDGYYNLRVIYNA